MIAPEDVRRNASFDKALPAERPVANEPKHVSAGANQRDAAGIGLGLVLRECEGVRAEHGLKPGETLYFPVLQNCGDKEEAWIAIPAAGQTEPETPAPGLKLTPAVSGDD